MARTLRLTAPGRGFVGTVGAVGDGADDAGRILTQISERRAVGKYVLTTA